MKTKQKNNKILPATSVCCVTVVRNECTDHFSYSILNSNLAKLKDGPNFLWNITLEKSFPRGKTKEGQKYFCFSLFYKPVNFRWQTESILLLLEVLLHGNFPFSFALFDPLPTLRPAQKKQTLNLSCQSQTVPFFFFFFFFFPFFFFFNET
jgi:hypothetical protein